MTTQRHGLVNRSGLRLDAMLLDRGFLLRFARILAIHCGERDDHDCQALHGCPVACATSTHA